MQRRRYWTKEEISTLQRLAAVPLGAGDTARILNRSWASVRAQAYRIGIELPPKEGVGSTGRDDQLLRELASAGYSQTLSAALLKRSRYAIHKRSLELALYWKPGLNFGPRYQPHEDVEVRRRIRKREPITRARENVGRSRRSPPETRSAAPDAI